MKILIVAATLAEVKPIFTHFGFNNSTFKSNEFELNMVITGVGIVATTFALTQKLETKNFNLVINLGVAGTFSNILPIGTLVEVIEEQMADMGAEDDQNFLSLFDLGLQMQNDFPFSDQKIKNEKPMTDLIKVSAITSTIAHGNEISIEKINNYYKPAIETMEGFAVFYVCKMKNISFVELRSISNLVEKRNRSNWNLPMAVKNLNDFAISFIEKLILLP